MIKKDSAWFEDMSRFASGAAGSLLDMKRELQSMVAAHCQEWLAHSPVVSREEFEAVADMAAKARAENETLKTQLAQMQAVVDSLAKP